MASVKTDSTPEILPEECLWQAAICRLNYKCRSHNVFALSVRNGMPSGERPGRPPNSACSASRLTPLQVGRRLAKSLCFANLARKSAWPLNCLGH